MKNIMSTSKKQIRLFLKMLIAGLEENQGEYIENENRLKKLTKRREYYKTNEDR